jgi:hypothetical protein
LPSLEALLDRLHERLHGLDGSAFVLELQRYTAAVADEPALAPILNDIEAEASNAQARFLAEENAILDDLAPLRDELAKRAPEIVWGDLSDNEYQFQKQVIEAEVDRLDPPIIVDVTEAAAVLTNFGVAWEAAATDPQEQNRLLRIMFERITVDGGEIVSITPRPPFEPYFYAFKTRRG